MERRSRLLAAATLLGAVACIEAPKPPPPGPDRAPRERAAAEVPVPAAARAPETDDGGEPPVQRRRFDIPDRFRKPLVFPEGEHNPVPVRPNVDVEPPTRKSLAAATDRCPEGVRSSLYVIDGGKTTALSYDTLLADGTPTDFGSGDIRPTVSIEAIADGAKKLEFWPCTGDPITIALPSEMRLLQTSRGFGKVIPDAETRRPVVRNIAGVVRIR